MRDDKRRRVVVGVWISGEKEKAEKPTGAHGEASRKTTCDVIMIRPSYPYGAARAIAGVLWVQRLIRVRPYAVTVAVRDDWPDHSLAWIRREFSTRDLDYYLTTIYIKTGVIILSPHNNVDVGGQFYGRECTYI